MTVQMDLKVDRTLLDPLFDGYKLSLDNLPQYQLTIGTAVDEAKLTDSQYSYQHIKAFGLHNYLQPDPWHPDTVFYVDEQWEVWNFTVRADARPCQPVSVFRIPDAANARLTPGRTNVTLSFPASDLAVVADGSGNLYIVHTQDRLTNEEWQICFSRAVLGASVCFSVVSSTLHTDGDVQHLSCLLLHVSEKENTCEETNGKNSSAFITQLEWITLSSVNGSDWAVARTRRLESSSSPDYISLDARAQCIIIASQKPAEFVYDSLKPVEKPKLPEICNKPHPAFTWTQTSEEVTVTFLVPSNVSKADVLFKLSKDHVELGVKNGPTLLKGHLFEGVDVDESTWTIAENKIELVLFKADKSSWPIVVPGDDRGEMVVDAAEAAEIHERLAHLTSESWSVDPAKVGKPMYNAQELDECDALPDEAAVLQRFDGDTHLCTHQVNLAGNQWLFNQQINPGRPAAFCLRHDVDGLIWQPTTLQESGSSPWKHVGTFNALGYVQASKQQKKFFGCAPNMSYSVLVDCVRHAYIYRQPASMLSPLRNRKTGEKVQAIAKQQLISLESTEDILGVHITSEQLFFLSGRTLYVVKVNDSSEDVQ